MPAAIPTYDALDARVRAQPSPEMGKTVCVTLTAAQIIAMYTTPQTIVADPLATEAVLVDDISVELILTGTAFTGGGVVHFYYNGQTVEIMAQTIAAATVGGSAGTTIWDLRPASTAGGSVVTAGKGLVITNATGVFAAGTGIAKVHCKYRVITL